MLKQFAQKIEQVRGLIDNSRSASFLLAVSGGMDSMCMLDLFCKVLPVERLAVAHCNFSLRDQESDGDQALVEQLAASLGVRVFVKRFDTVGYARQNGISIEMAARDLRYGWFAQLCAEHGFDVLAVAHNANDNAETLMLNLLRGTGLAGLHGMAEVSDAAVRVFRPLLGFTRKQIEGHVLTNRVPYRHDSSNFESDYKRNKIRNEVFPVFERINPSVVRTLNREIGYFAEAESIVEQWCRSQLPAVISNSGTSIDKDGVAENLIINTHALLSVPQWRYLLYYILSPYGFNHQLLDSVESLLTSSRTVSGKRFESDTHVLVTERDHMVLKSRTEECVTDVMVVRGAGIYNFNGVRFQVELLKRDPDLPLKQPVGTLLFDADKMRIPFVCRRWRQGDWMIPFGMKGKKKVSDIFADLKYTSADKSSAIILVDTRSEGLAEMQNVAALAGQRIDDRYRITSSTENILKITVL